MLPLRRPQCVHQSECCKIQKLLPFATSEYLGTKLKCKAEHLPFFQEYNGLPDVTKLSLLGQNQDVLLILDDLSFVAYRSKNTALLFSNTSKDPYLNQKRAVHICFCLPGNHERLSIIIATQNAFLRDVQRRNIAVNLTHYVILRDLGKKATLVLLQHLKMILLVFAGDQNALRTLSSHLSTRVNNYHLFQEIMQWLDDTFTLKQDKYIFVNCHNDSVHHHSLRLCTHIFPTELPDGTFEAARPIFFNDE